jgi:hypothetical protein
MQWSKPEPIKLRISDSLRIGAVPVSIGGPGKKMEKTTVGDFDSEVISPSILRIKSQDR